MQPIFAQIYKIDEQRREVTGRATQEIVDRDGEVMDYFSSKPNFMAWSAEIYKDSGGLSHGNVRAMHGNVCAGKLTDITFDDAERAVDVTAKIIDDNEWEKVCEGAYLGFSIGGRYTKKWADIVNEKVVQRYTAMPNEISIVDRPSCSTAKFFRIHKRDGSIMKKLFQNAGALRKTNIEFRGGKIGLIKGAELDVFKSILARPQPFDPDFLQKFDADPAIGRNAGVREIRKAHRSPVRADISFDALGLSKAFDSRRLQKCGVDGYGRSADEVRIGKRMRNMRKVGFPPNSSNGISGGAIADTGASNDFHDQRWTPPKPNVIGGQVVTDVSRSPNIQAVLDALKQDMSKPKRMAL